MRFWRFAPEKPAATAENHILMEFVQQNENYPIDYPIY